MSISEVLKSVPFFDHFTDTQIDDLVHMGRPLKTEADQVLFQMGDLADSLYVILNGCVRVYGKDPEGKPVELSTLRKGQFFGELALVDGGTRSATVRTGEPCEFFVIERSNFMRLLSASPELLSDVLAGITSKIKSSNEKIFLEMLEKQRLQSQMEIDRHRSLSEMVAGVAHEINTPLGIVNVTASMITENLTPDLLARATDPELKYVLEDIQEAAQLMLSNIARANKLIQSFKSVSVNQIMDTLETGLFVQLIQEVIDLFKIKARQAHLSLETEFEPGVELLAWTGYPGYLSQILMNFFSNIERYAYPAGVGGRILVKLSSFERDNKPFFRLVVQDFGKGIPKEDVSRVFDVFFTTGRGQGGTGLGMSIVHNLVTSALHGSITLDSELGQGTTVTVEFPHQITPQEHLAG
ncbi:MAG: cyclic nucleotide-binding domain-containing protein [Candidatus Sericytochromatia bacterium]|nr:cyclic nucleotide-binding domain-containing protein [Candidatus Sericytochromatia bacterium]